MDKTKLAQLAIARQNAEEARLAITAMLAELKASQEYVMAETNGIAANEQINNLTTQIKAEAEEEYKRTGQKSLDGVTVKLLKRYTCTDEKEAFEWAIQKNQTFLQIDWKSLTQEAKALYGTSYALPFFQEQIELSCQIKSDLSEYLE